MKKNFVRSIVVTGAVLFTLAIAPHAWAADPKYPMATGVGSLETVAIFPNSMPTGVAVSHRGRIFVSFPRWGDPTPFTVGEIRQGVAVPFPNAAINNFDSRAPGQTFASVQSVVIDAQDRLWALDTGSPEFLPVLPDTAKLVCMNLQDNTIFRTITFPPSVVLPASYLNDVRFDLHKGLAGTAYISDSSDAGSNAIIVVDLASGQGRRLLENSFTVKAEPQFQPIVDGKPLLERRPGHLSKSITTGVDGIALSADGSWLYYCALASHHLYAVPTAALLNTDLTSQQVADSVKDLGPKPASDGLEPDSQGRLYLTDYEDNAILRRDQDRSYVFVATNANLVWPDSMCLATDNHLYVTANQLCRSPRFHDGVDLRIKPYYLFRIRVDAPPALLGQTISQSP
jgi:sugar lactone lactonase YvrE